jgi:rubrerythrin
MTKTEENLKQAIYGEAKARLEYTAFAMEAMKEKLPEYAQLFMEAAGAETMYPNYIKDAAAEGQTDAAASFGLALERERHHRAMFKKAFESFKTSKLVTG